MASTANTMSHDTVQELFSGFAGPMAAMDQALFDLLLMGFAREGLTQALKNYPELCEKNAALVAVIENVIDEGLTRELAWDVSLGMVYMALSTQGDMPEISLAFAHVALWFHLGGHRGRWEMRFSQPVRLRMDRFFLPPLSGISVSALGETILVESLDNDAPPIRFWREKGEWQATGAETFTQVNVGNCKLTLLTNPDILPEKKDRQTLIQDRQGIDAMADMLRQALNLMRDGAPEYFEWVSRTIRYIIPTRTEDGALASGTTLHAYGQIHASITEIALPLAESLVHESSHQHFYIAARFMPIMNGEDSALYYSPPVRADRQVDKILLAFHAFVNVLDLSTRFTDSDLPDRHYARQNIGLATSDLSELIKPLRATAGLSAVGRAMADPLIEYLEKGGYFA